MHNLVISILKLILTIILSMIGVLGFTQTLLKARVLDVKNNPIPFAQIAIPDYEKGTISDLNGYFIFEFEDDIDEYASLTIEHVGYQELFIQLGEIIKNPVITLEENIYEFKPAIIGSFRTAKPVGIDKSVIGFAGKLLLDTNNSGMSYAIKFDNVLKYSTDTLSYVPEKVEFEVLYAKNYRIRLGLRICTIDPISGLPEHDLLPELLVLDTTLFKRGGVPSRVVVSFDLTGHRLLVDEPVYIIIQHLQTFDEMKNTISALEIYRDKNPRMVKEREVIIDGDTSTEHIYRLLPFKRLPLFALAGCSKPKCLDDQTTLYKESAGTAWRKSTFVPSVYLTGYKLVN